MEEVLLLVRTAIINNLKKNQKENLRNSSQDGTEKTKILKITSQSRDIAWVIKSSLNLPRSSDNLLIHNIRINLELVYICKIYPKIIKKLFFKLL